MHPEILPQHFQNESLPQAFPDQGVRADSTTSRFSLDSKPSWPYDLNHKQVLTVAFPSNLILPYIALAIARGLFQIQADGVEWGPMGPVLSFETPIYR